MAAAMVDRLHSLCTEAHFAVFADHKRAAWAVLAFALFGRHRL